ncbi:MAG: mannose-6-phosphate isomerase [Bacteroidales bacterium]|nr:mannose-6-phosphate isomerase [Bacteroidales bacterium]
MAGLYPMKFRPIFQSKIWGGGRLFKDILNKECSGIENCGEIWELSAVEGFISVVDNGYLEGNNITELVEIYMGDLVGDRVYEKYGIEFPLLVKYIDTKEDLSIQVHPGDELARLRHFAYGKTEMWYVVYAEKGSSLISGFKKPVTKDTYLKYFHEGKLTDLLYIKDVNPGDVLFIPAGKVHAIGKGLLVAEIQQTSDITYRIYDYERKDNLGNLRELHTDLALDAIDFNSKTDFLTDYSVRIDEPAEILKCDYFATNILQFKSTIERDYHKIDSFIILMNLEGRYSIKYDNGEEEVDTGETVLIPATLELLKFIPLTPEVKLLEIYVPGD